MLVVRHFQERTKLEMGEIEKNIEEHVNWFFNKINISIIENYYIENLQNWDALCASLTILNDLQSNSSSSYTEYPKVEGTMFSIFFPLENYK